MMETGCDGIHSGTVDCGHSFGNDNWALGRNDSGFYFVTRHSSTFSTKGYLYNAQCSHHPTKAARA